MAHIIKGCQCKGNIEVIPFREDDGESQNYGKMIVSHGVCQSCLRTICLPPEEYYHFILVNCEGKQ